MDDLSKIVTDQPKSCMEDLLNFAYDKNGRVFLRYADGIEGYDLCTYVSDRLADLGYEVTPDEIMENGMAFGNEETEPLAVLYNLAVQAAELRGRLRKYEEAKPIVHCKDCIHARMYCFGCGDEPELACCEIEDDDGEEFIRVASSVDPDDFCSRGESRVREEKSK